jgi:hypothetical protein
VFLQPFPNNPSFNPPPPLHNDLKEAIYEGFRRRVRPYPGSSQQPIDEEVAVRELAQRHHISMPRVQAIIRLKALERQWQTEGKPLQTDFLAGMESALGVQRAQNSTLREDLLEIVPLSKGQSEYEQVNDDAVRANPLPSGTRQTPRYTILSPFSQSKISR